MRLAEDVERTRAIELDCLSTTQVEKLTGATFRQLDYWVRNRLLHPRNPFGGSGTSRSWRKLDVEVARCLVEFFALVGASEGTATRAISEALYAHDWAFTHNKYVLVVYRKKGQNVAEVTTRLRLPSNAYWLVPLRPLEQAEIDA